MDFFSGIANFIAGLINYEDAQKAYNSQQDQLDQILAAYSGLRPPELREAQAPTVGASAYDAIQEDPQLRALQLRALEGLGTEATQRGLGAQDRAALAEAIGASGRHEAGLRGALAQRAAATGMGGANASLVQALQGQQAAANSANQQALDVAGQARQRQLAALAQVGTQAAGVRGQDYSMARDRAAAQNQLNQFNAGLQWQAQQHNLQTPQQDFENLLRKMQLEAEARRQRGQSSVDRARTKAGYATQAAGGAGSAAAGLATTAGIGLGGAPS